MIIVTSPMCEEILKKANINDYIVNKYPDTVENVDIAIVLSETKTNCPTIKLKLNTPEQIIKSTEFISKYFNTEINNKEILNEYLEIKEIQNNLDKYREKNRYTNIKVYSNFLTEIIEDLGYDTIDDDYEYIVYPDYLKNKVIKEDKILIEVPSHNTVSKNPFIRCINRYKYILEHIK